MKEKLIIMNGRWVRRDQHVYVCARSKADAARLLKQANNGYGNFVNEINIYFSKGCWGNPMEGITPERGVWIQTANKKPERII